MYPMSNTTIQIILSLMAFMAIGYWIKSFWTSKDAIDEWQRHLLVSDVFFTIIKLMFFCIICIEIKTILQELVK